MRARFSGKTIRILSARKTLKRAFIDPLIDVLDADYDLILIELNTGSYGVVPMKALEAAKARTAKIWLTDDERKALKRGTLNFAALEKEVAPPEDDQPDDDE
jgi:hypothetical protein